MDDLTAVQAMTDALNQRSIGDPAVFRQEINTMRVDRGLGRLTEGRSDVTTEPDAPDPMEAATEASELDVAIYARPSDPTGYKFSLPDGPTPTAEQAEQLSSVRVALWECGIPASLASAADALIGEGLRNPPDPARQEQLRQAGHAQLARRYGDQLPQVLSSARNEWARLAARVPGLAAAVERSGMANSSFFVSSLFALHLGRRGRK